MLIFLSLYGPPVGNHSCCEFKGANVHKISIPQHQALWWGLAFFSANTPIYKCPMSHAGGDILDLRLQQSLLGLGDILSLCIHSCPICKKLLWQTLSAILFSGQTQIIRRHVDGHTSIYRKQKFPKHSSVLLNPFPLWLYKNSTHSACWFASCNFAEFTDCFQTQMIVFRVCFTT